MTLILHRAPSRFPRLETIYWTGEAARLDPAFDKGIEKAAARIAEIAAAMRRSTASIPASANWRASGSMLRMSPPCSATLFFPIAVASASRWLKTSSA